MTVVNHVRTHHVVSSQGATTTYERNTMCRQPNPFQPLPFYAKSPQVWVRTTTFASSIGRFMRRTHFASYANITAGRFPPILWRTCKAPGALWVVNTCACEAKRNAGQRHQYEPLMLLVARGLARRLQCARGAYHTLPLNLNRTSKTRVKSKSTVDRQSINSRSTVDQQ